MKGKIAVTHHAKNRIREFGLSIGQALALLNNAVPEYPVHLARYKREKYKEKQKGTEYFRNGTYLFIGKRILDKFTGEPTFLLITFTDQRINLKKL